MTDGMLPSWIKEKEDEADKDLNYEGKNEFDNKKELQDDFLSKMIHRKINSYDDFYAMAEDKSISMAI